MNIEKMRSNRRAGIIQTFHVIQTDTKNFPTKGFFPTNHFEDVKLSIISMSIHRMCLILCLARIKIEAVKVNWKHEKRKSDEIV